MKKSWKLLNDRNELVKAGDVVTDFRGDRAIVAGWKPPHKPESTGRIYVRPAGNPELERGFFPSVFNCLFVHTEDAT